MDSNDQYEYDPDDVEPPVDADNAPPRFDCSNYRATWRAKPRMQRLSQWMQYLYFSRFCVLAWLLLPLLCCLDGCTGVSALTRGIMTLGRQWQAFYAAFFVTALMITVLVCVRNIVRNGQERFKAEPPLPLRCRLQSDRARDMLGALAIALLPALVTLTYIAVITLQEQRVPLRGGHFAVIGFGAYAWRLWVGYASGLLFAFCFWYLVSLVYLWTYPATPGVLPAPLIFPIGMPGFDGARGQDQPRLAVWLEGAAKIALKLTHEGYAADASGPLWELHSFTTVALAAFFVLYLLLYPLLAPVNIGRGWLDGAISCGIALLFVVGASDAPKKTNPVPTTTAHHPALRRFATFCRSCWRIGSMGRIFLAFNGVLLALFLLLIFRDGHSNSVLLETAFPALASILVITIFGLWLMAGLSFLLDRYRLPVLTMVLLLIVGMKFLPVDQEHYFTTVPATRMDESKLMVPRAILDRQQKPTGEPLIVVTASGGGIQAAEWTAQVLSALESRFHDDADLQRNHYTFHDHVLLLSGVSGGSVGLMPFLLEYTADPALRFPRQARQDTGDQHQVDALHDRLTLAPGCSSLEAIAWGLEYYDLQRLLLTFRIPWLQSTAEGVAPDRTWALSRALDRNLNNRDCGTNGLLPPPDHPHATTASGLPGILSGRQLTLKASAENLWADRMPAFTFNTTVAETGGRFLLSNYGLPVPVPKATVYPVQSGTDTLPAETFLHAYTQASRCDQGVLRQDCYADLSLSTAAQLSATFPIVSSGTRLPKQFAARASHFVDGGYFDNDGTASVIEFLKSALLDRCKATPQPVAELPKEEHPLAPAVSAPVATAPCDPTPAVKPPLRILLVEIRDGDDLNPEENQDDWNHQTGLVREAGKSGPQPWSTNTQLLAPLMGMWQAGHVSVTRRNRRELCLLEQAWGDRLELRHVVLGIPAQSVTGRADQYKTAPLSWKLTAAQKAYIENWAVHGEPARVSMQNAIDWVKGKLEPATRPAAPGHAPPTDQPGGVRGAGPELHAALNRPLRRACAMLHLRLQ